VSAAAAPVEASPTPLSRELETTLERFVDLPAAAREATVAVVTSLLQEPELTLPEHQAAAAVLALALALC